MKPLPDSVNVIWTLYSGLPDPGWAITNQATLQDLSAMLSSLPRADSTKWRDHLGPDCFVLSCPRGSKLPMLIEVSRGFVKLHEDATNKAAVTVLNDEKKRVKAILDKTRPEDLKQPY